MLSTAVDRFAVIASVALACAWNSMAVAAQTEASAVVVARLYKDFAWQAMATQRHLFGEDLAHQGKASLEKYFAPPLAELLVRDAACQVKAQGICNLDFDLLFDSQDPRVTDLDVQAVAPDKVSVAFKDPVSEEKTKIDFNLAHVAGKWRIVDISYGKNSGTSLKKILSRKVP